jgi:hypothetical protein
MGAKAHKARPRTESLLGWPDGRRKLGTVGRTIVQVLSEGEEMSVSAIRIEVERLLHSSFSLLG